MLARITLVLLVVFTTYSCQSQEEQKQQCPFPNQIQAVYDDCGIIEVPNDYNDPSKGTTSLAYIVIKSKSPNRKPDPVVFIQGGPGGSVLPLANVYSQINIDRDRDYILYDQRGIGFSDEICPGLSAELLDVMAMNLSVEDEFKELQKRIKECESVLAKDATRFSTDVNAKDLDQLRKHLGYKQLNLFGGSYGTRLGLEYMRQFPDHVRSSVLSGLFGPNIRMYDNLLTDFHNSIKKMFKACESDSTCNTKYPNLKDDFYEVYSSLDNTPITLESNGNNFTVNTQDFLLIVHQFMYNEHTIVEVPGLINSMKNKEYGALQDAVNTFLFRIRMINLAVYWSIMQSDESHHNNTKRLYEDARKNPKLKSGLSLFAVDLDVYKEWPEMDKNAQKLTPVNLDIPTLLISGDYDPITPPKNAKGIAKYLKNSQNIVFKNGGHVPINACFFGMAKAFLDNPNSPVDSGCSDTAIQINWD